jgi:hypothetical protein
MLLISLQKELAEKEKERAFSLEVKWSELNIQPLARMGQAVSEAVGPRESIRRSDTAAAMAGGRLSDQPKLDEIRHSQNWRGIKK